MICFAHNGKDVIAIEEHSIISNRIYVSLLTDKTEPFQEYTIDYIDTDEKDKRCCENLMQVLSVELKELAESEIGRQLEVIGIPAWNERCTPLSPGAPSYKGEMYRQLFWAYHKMIKAHVNVLAELVFDHGMTIDSYWAMRGGKPQQED